MSESSTAASPALEGYDGPAQLVAPDTVVAVEVRLRGQFQPIDGRYHWYGRLSASDRVDALVAGRAALVLRTPYGEGAAQVGDPDPWGRYRVSGTGRPPFPV